MSEKLKKALFKKEAALQFTDKDIFFDGKSLSDWLQKFSPPFYLFSVNECIFRARYFLESIKAKLPNHEISLHYAIKANDNPDLLRAFQQNDLGIDTVSWGEIQAALNQGIRAKKILFSGVAKSEVEIRESLKAQIGQFNIESLPELERIIHISQDLNLKARVGIRFNPDVVAETHPAIATGFREHKFGLDKWDVFRAAKLIRKHASSIDYCGLSIHIGSQLFEFSALREAIEKSIELDQEIEKVEGLRSHTFDLGGGLGIDYRGDPEHDEEVLQSYAETVALSLRQFPKRLLFEPGRFLVARAGILVTRIEYIKKTAFKSFLIVNAGMNALMRPMLYDAYHPIWIYPLRPNHLTEIYDVVGPICESTDTIAHRRQLPMPIQKDTLIIGVAGAYGRVMSNKYNLFGDIHEFTRFPNDE